MLKIYKNDMDNPKVTVCKEMEDFDAEGIFLRRFCPSVVE